MLASESEKGSSAGSALSGPATALDKEKTISSDALAKVELLNQQIAAMRRQLQTLNALLTDAEIRNKASEAQIADLGKRLNSALAQRVQELTRYRSEFFGRLRQILSQRSDILVVGDRFVFQAEVLFEKGKAELNPEGQARDAEAGGCAEAARDAKSRPTSPGCCASTATPTSIPFSRPSSGPTGNCRRRAPSRWSIS